MKRHFWKAALILLAATSARAESWMFNPSYYSHDPVTQVRIGRQYAPGPVYSRPVGQYYNSGYRFNRSSIIVRGQVFDNTNVFEGWYQLGTQF